MMYDDSEYLRLAFVVTSRPAGIGCCRQLQPTHTLPGWPHTFAYTAEDCSRSHPSAAPDSPDQRQHRVAKAEIRDLRDTVGTRGGDLGEYSRLRQKKPERAV
jgi:hypothetical protein